MRAIEQLVPASVVQSVLVRLARLGPTCQRLAAAVAVLGGDAAMRHVTALAELELPAAEQAADRLADAHVLAAGALLRFAHPLIASAVSADRPAFARARAHRLAAGLLAAEGAPAEVVSVQLAAQRTRGATSDCGDATPGRQPRAGARRRAGRRAASQTCAGGATVGRDPAPCAAGVG